MREVEGCSREAAVEEDRAEQVRAEAADRDADRVLAEKARLQRGRGVNVSAHHAASG